MSQVILCADSESLLHPELIGLDDENLGALPWLLPFSSACEARAHAHEAQDVKEVWIASSDDVEAINLAAALKRDNASLRVYLVAFETSGSLLSRVDAAGVNGALSKQGFVRRFAQEKRRHLQEEASCEQEAEAQDVSPGDGRGGRSGAHAMSLARPTAQGSGAFLMTVVSGSGGAGKSAVAAVAAYLACRRGHRTLLLDADLQFGDLHWLTGASGRFTLDQLLLEEGTQAWAALPDGAGHPTLLAAPRRLEQAEVLPRRLSGKLDDLLARYDVVVANTGAHWAEHHAVLLERSACVLFLVDQRASSVRACRHALDLCSRCGIASGSFQYVLNRCSRTAPLTSIDVSCALQGAHVSELKDGGSAVEELLGAGMIDELLASRNDFCLSVDRLLEDVLPESGVGLRGSAEQPKAGRGAVREEAARLERRDLRRKRKLLKGRSEGGGSARDAKSRQGGQELCHGVY